MTTETNTMPDDSRVQETWLTVPEIARRLRVHPQTVREWLRTGALKGYSFGKRTGWRIRERDLEAFLAQREGPDTKT